MGHDTRALHYSENNLRVCVKVIARREQFGEDISGLQELVTYGLKGMMAYSEHAAVLGHHK